MKIASARRVIRLLHKLCLEVPDHCAEIVTEIQASPKLLRAAELEGIEIADGSMVDRTAPPAKSRRPQRRSAGS